MSILIFGSPDWMPPEGVEVRTVGSVEGLVSLPGEDPIVTGEADLGRVLTVSGERPVVVVGDVSCEAAWLRAGATEVIAPGADPEAAQCVLDRATARAEAGARARAFEHRYRALLGALPDVISRLRNDGLTLDFYVPDEFVTEFPPNAMLGKRLADVIPASLAAQFETAVTELRETGAAEPYRYSVDVDGASRVREVRIVANGPDEVLSILRDVTELERRTAELERSRGELRALAVRLQAVREEERARLSRDVHDVIGQGLTAIRLVAGGIARRHPDDPEVQTRVDDLRGLVDETIGTVRRLSTDLRPGVLDDLGLVAAVEWQARRFEERTGLTCVVEADASLVPGRPAEPLGTALFRIVQEALTNVARHAKASEVLIRLVLDGDTLCLEVRDDGAGLGEPDTERRPLGIVGMRERALAAGGTLELAQTDEGGVLVRGTFPRVLRPSP